MPAVSQAQYRLMRAAASGKARNISISPAKAKEYIAGQSPKGLPEHVSSRNGEGRMARAARKAKRGKLRPGVKLHPSR